MDRNIFENLCDSIVSCIDEDTKEKYGELIQHISEVKSPEDFQHMLMMPLKNAARQAICMTYPGLPRGKVSRLGFIFSNYNEIENHYSTIVRRIDGAACCVDKARYLIEQTIKHIITGDVFDLSKDGKEYTYHIPSFWIDKGGEEWVSLFEALYFFKYGNGVKYLEWCANYLIPIAKTST